MPFKIAVIGPKASGKSALLDRLIDQKFDPKSSSTLETQLKRHQLKLKVDHETTEPIQLQFWDTSSHPYFLPINKIYCRSAQAIFLTCDLTQNFEEQVKEFVKNNLADLDHLDPPLIVLVGTKLDQASDDKAAENRLHVLQEQLLEQQKLSCTFVLTSALNNVGIIALGRLVAAKLHQPHHNSLSEKQPSPKPEHVEVPMQQAPKLKPARWHKVRQTIKGYHWRYSLGLLLAIGVILLITLPIVAQTLGAASLISWLLINTAAQLGTSLFITKIIASIGLGALAFFSPTLIAYLLKSLSHTLKSISTLLGNLGERLSNAAYNFKHKLWRGLIFTAYFLTYLCARLVYAVSYIVKHISLFCLGQRKDKQPSEHNRLAQDNITIGISRHTADNPHNSKKTIIDTDIEDDDQPEGALQLKSAVQTLTAHQ